MNISRSWTMTCLLLTTLWPAHWVSAQNVACLGQIVPGDRVVRLAAPANAIIGELRVQRGSKVEQGDIIAVLRDAPVYQAQLDRMKEQVALAEAELLQARAGERPELIEAQQSLIVAHQAEVKMLESRAARYESLIEKKFVDQDSYDGLLSQIDSLQAQIHREESVLESLGSSRKEVLAQAEIAVHVAEAQVAEANASLELQNIRAPFAGEVLEVHAWPGEGNGDRGAIISLGNTQHMRVLAEVYESDLSRVKIGQRAQIRGQAFTEEFGGEVEEIHKVIESSRIFPLDPAAYVDRRIVIVRIRPDDPTALSAFSEAHAQITIQVP